MKRYFVTLTAELTQGADTVPLNVAAFDAIRGRQVVSVRTRFGGKTLLKKTVCSAAVGAVLTLVLKEGSLDRQTVPLQLVHHLSTNGFSNGLPVGYVVDYSSSSIQIQDPAAVTTGEVVELVFEIEK